MVTVLRPVSEEFEELYNVQFPRVYNYIFFHTGHAETAEDLTADVFVRAYTYWDTFDHAKGDRGAWVGGIARNALRKHYRGKSRGPKVVELTELFRADSDIEGEYEHVEDIDRLMKRVRKLPERQRELLAMKYMLQMTYREIAAATGMTESNVSVTLHRTITELRKKF